MQVTSLPPVEGLLPVEPAPPLPREAVAFEEDLLLPIAKHKRQIVSNSKLAIHIAMQRIKQLVGALMQAIVALGGTIKTHAPP